MNNLVKMKLKIKFLLITILSHSIISPEVIGQKDPSEQALFNQIYSAAEKEYGIDQVLVNGVYFENIYARSLGHPYLQADTFKNGSVVFRGEKYSDILLKYDTYNQHLLVKYLFKDVPVIFYLPVEYISEFLIENRKFEKRAVKGEQAEIIFQIIGEHYPVQLTYRWEKISYRSFHNVIPSYAFSLDMKTSYIVLGENIFPFKGNGSFARIFPEQYQKEIKKYIRGNKIKVKRETDLRMERLINYINSLYNS
jgi:hypothetical protein